MLLPFPEGVLKLAAGGLECVSDRHVDVLMGSVDRGLAAHRNVGSIGNHKMNLDVKDVSLVMAVLRAGDNDARTDDAAGELLQLFNFLFDASFDRVGMLDAIECDL